MAQTLLSLLILVCLVLLVWGFQKPQRMLQYPFLATAIFSGWVLPQLAGLSTEPTRFPPGALSKTIFMTLLCVVACYVGHIINKRPFSAFNWSFDHRRLLTAATVISLIGSYFFYRVSLLREDAGSQWSGEITILAFFSELMTVGLVVAVVTYLHHPSRWALAIIGFDLIFFFDRIVIHGRRRAVIELSMIIGLALWFRFRKLPPRPLIAAILLVGALWINSVGDYRSVMLGTEGQGLAGITQIDFVGNLRRIATEGGSELTNALHDIEAFDQRGNFDWGKRYWNRFVRLYVPGQLIGEEVKRSMMLPQDPAALILFGYRSPTGSTRTGISHVFQSFWYFGAIEFLIIAYFMRSFFRAADRGHFVAQILLMLIFAGALESITHNTERFFLAWPRIILFLGPVLWFSKVRQGEIWKYYLPKQSLCESSLESQ